MKKTWIALLLLLSVSAHATVNFPSLLDNDATLHLMVTGDHYIASFHNNLKDALIATETAVGVTSDASAGSGTSLTFKLLSPSSVDPGHTHTGTSIAFADGSAGAPAIRFGNPVTDTTTGLFHPGTGIVAVSISGSEVTRITSTGVGILTSPFFPLDVAGIVRVQGSNKLCFGGTGGADNDTCVQRTAAHVITWAGNTIVQDQATTDNSITATGIASKTGKFLQFFLLAADTQPAMDVNAAGQCLEIGAGGSSAVDATICRTGAAALTLTGAVTVTSNLTISGTGTQSIGGSGATVSLATSGSSTVNVGGASSTVNIVGTKLVATASTLTLAEAENVVVGTATGTQIGTSASQRLGFFGATPVVQPAAATDLRTALINLGLYGGGATPLNLNGGAFTTTGTLTIGTSGSALARYLTGSGSLSFTGPSANSCATDQTISVTNAAVGDLCEVGPDGPSAASAGAIFTCFVNSTNTVSVRYCCANGASTCAAVSTKTFKVALHQ